MLWDLGRGRPLLLSLEDEVEVVSGGGSGVQQIGQEGGQQGSPQTRQQGGAGAAAGVSGASTAVGDVDAEQRNAGR